MATKTSLSRTSWRRGRHALPCEDRVSRHLEWGPVLEYAERDHPPDRAGKRHPLRLEDCHRAHLDAGIDLKANVHGRVLPISSRGLSNILEDVISTDKDPEIDSRPKLVMRSGEGLPLGTPTNQSANGAQTSRMGRWLNI